MDVEQIELLPCPFCGGAAEIRKWQDEELWSHAIVEWQKAHCTECECEGISSCPGCEPDTVEAWNTRAALTPPEGYVLVPVEPTMEMLREAAKHDYYSAKDPTWRDLYQVMLAARPEMKND